DGQRRGIRRREEAEADEQEGQPKDQNEEKRPRKLGLRLFEQQPAALTELTNDPQRLGEELSLHVGPGDEFAQPVLDEFHAIRALEGGQRRHAGLLHGPDHLDASRDGAPELFAGGLGVRAVARESPIQEDDLGVALHDPGFMVSKADLAELTKRPSTSAVSVAIVPALSLTTSCVSLLR